MKASAKKYMTTGVALVGVGVIAAGPVAPAPANIRDGSRSYEVALTAAAQKTEIQRQIEARQALLENFAPGGLLEDFIEGTLTAYNRPGSVAVHEYNKVTGIDGIGRIGQGFTASGLRLGATALAPLRLIELAQAISDGEGAEGFEAIVTNIVDAPLWVVDPALFALRDALPAPLGGPDGLVMAIRQQLYLLTGEINDGLKDPGAFVESFVKGTIDAFERSGPVDYVPVDGPIDGFSRVTQGAIASTLRLAAAAVLGPVGVIQVAAAVAQGDTVGALKTVENIVDGPLWVADPVLYGLRDALPAPLGGPTNLVENFRNQLWSATERINGAIRDAVEGPAPEAPNQLEDNSVSGMAAVQDEQIEKIEENNGSDLTVNSEQPKITQQDRRPLGGLLSNTPLSKLRPPAIKVIKNSLNFSPGAKPNEKGPKGNVDGADGATQESPGTGTSGTATTGTTGTGNSASSGTTRTGTSGTTNSTNGGGGQSPSSNTDK